MPRFLGFVLFAFAVTGCAAESVELMGNDGDEEDVRPLRARIVVERLTDEGTVRTSAAAKFFHASDADVREAERFIGALPVLPAEGECVAQASYVGAELPTDLAVDLLDVGDVTIDATPSTRGGSEPDVARMLLSARAFPDVGEIASGIFYTSPDAELDLAAPAHYRVSTVEEASSRTVVIEGFAPSPPRITESLSFTQGRDLRVEWSKPSSEEVGYVSEVYIDFVGARTFRCSFLDEGAAVLPAEVTREANADGSATVVVHRVVRQSTVGSLPAASGELEGTPYDAVILFDLADARSLASE